MIKKDPERFVLLGERLALEFSDALDDVLSIARRQGLQKTLEQGGERAERLVHAGGGFVTMSVARGLITDDGELHASRLLPQVLFRRKWCAMAGHEKHARLSETEELVNLDFLVAFGGPRPPTVGCGPRRSSGRGATTTTRIWRRPWCAEPRETWPARFRPWRGSSRSALRTSRPARPWRR